MPNFVEVTDEELQAVEDDGGLSKNTKAARLRDYTQALVSRDFCVRQCLCLWADLPADF